MRTITQREAVVRAELLAGSRAGRPFVLGIVGAPGAGKSTITESLGHPVLPMDGYHLANDELDRLGLRDRKGAPETFDVSGFVAALARIRAAEDVDAPLFDRSIDASIADALHLPATAPLIVTEGNYLLHDASGWEKVRPLLDEVWFLDIDDDIRRDRLIIRQQRYGRSVEEAAAWTASVDDPNAALVQATRHRADLLVSRD
ncbi:nucleoside/nucleotide kinase family protein [Microbacterium sp.]|uniref:nucleoside/nucleotide kinase family protein n=1 Tax=Microbacterium sp. TaxID=51671 RepID=UPI002810A687|nr:nucleoside/nucleotide kinase family protein [Microbacterium sp.]